MKIAFVTPWYGKDIPGGAELECRKTALHLMQIGIDVEILTTRVKDFHSDWSKNFHTATISNDNGLVVRRFKVKRRNNSAFDRINQKLLCANSDLAFLFNNKASPIRYCEEEVFIQEMINCPSLYKYIRKNKDQYDFFVFIPYMFGTTYYGSIECPDNALLIPCLHNESYAYMDIYKEMFSRFKGFLFHVKSEETLAKYLYNIEDDRTYLIGEGVETDIKYKPDRFLQKYKIDVPFLLYVGRKDRTKNIDFVNLLVVVS